MLLILIVVAVALPARASSAPSTIKDLVRVSDLIVIATVGPIGEDGIAAVNVEEVVKGDAPGELRVRATPVWMCDDTHLVSGTRVLLFLGTGHFRYRDAVPEPDPPGVLFVQGNGAGQVVIYNDGAEPGFLLHLPENTPITQLRADGKEAVRTPFAPLLDYVRACIKNRRSCSAKGVVYFQLPDAVKLYEAERAEWKRTHPDAVGECKPCDNALKTER